MSIVVAVKYNNGVVLGADRQITSDYHLAKVNTEKIFKSKYSNTAYGMVGCLRDIDIVSCNMDDLMGSTDILEKVELDKKYVVNHVVPEVFNLMMKYNRATKVDCVITIDSSVLVASSNNIYSISHDGAVLEYNNFGAIGCGLELVQGHLDTLPEKAFEDLSEPEAIDLIKRCVQLACKSDVYINDDVDIIVLKKKGK